jgi:hypothetical protein
VPNSDVILQFNSSGYNPLDHLPIEWEQNRMQIDMRIFGFGSGNIVYQNLCEASSNGLSASAGAGNMLDTGVPKPPSELGESDEQITAKYKAWSIEVQLKRKYLQKVCEHLLAGRYPPEDTSTPFVPRPGTLAARVSLPNSGCSSAVMFANQLETTGFRRAPNGMGPGKALAEMASKCLKEIRRIRGDPNFKVPAGAVGMPGATGLAMDASIKLSDLRRLFPGRDFSAAEVGMPGGAGRNIDASIKLRALRDLYPDLIVTAEMCGVTGGAGQNIDASIKLQEYRALDPDLIVTAEMCGMTGAPGRSMDASNMLHVLRTESPGQAVSAADVGMPGPPGKNMDAALHNADLPLMQKDPSQYSSTVRTQLEEQQAQHKKLMDQGVLFSVDGNVCTPCKAHQFLELKLKSLNSDNASSSASFSLQKAYERMGEQGNLRLVKVCSKFATPTSPGVKGFDIYAYYPPPPLSTAQSASSSDGGSVVQEPVQPSAFTALMSSTGGPIKRTVCYDTARQAHNPSRNGSFKCTWPGCTSATFSRPDSRDRHFNRHTEGSTVIKKGRPSHKKNLKK